MLFRHAWIIHSRSPLLIHTAGNSHITVIDFDSCPNAFSVEPNCTTGYSTWGSWDSCSLSCGNGTQTRTRICYDGNSSICIDNGLGDSYETQECNTDACPTGYAPWSNWGSCSESCGNGTESRTRTCYDGDESICINNNLGASNESRPCNLGDCPTGWVDPRFC